MRPSAALLIGSEASLQPCQERCGEHLHAISAQKQAFNLVIQHAGKLTDAASRKQGTADEAIHRDPIKSSQVKSSPIKGYVALLQVSLRFIFGHKPAGEAVFSIPAENGKNTASTPARARCWCGAAGRTWYDIESDPCRYPDGVFRDHHGLNTRPLRKRNRDRTHRLNISLSSSDVPR